MDEPEYSEESGLHIIVPGTEPIVDIIAIHGLAANPVYTWIKQVPVTQSNNNVQPGRVNKQGKREVVWLKHLLPEVIPNARIIKFNYDSRYLMGAPKENLRSIASRLVLGIHELRTREINTLNRPIVFLGHSFGGIVIEEALLYSYHHYMERLQYIAFNTCGVLFLGTPHRGCSASSWGEMIAKSASVLGFGSDSQLLQTLKVGSERLEILLSDFSLMARRLEMELVCFYELRETQLGKPFGIKTTVVKQESATIPGYEIISLPLDHTELNKFGSFEEESFKLISLKLREAIARGHNLDRKLSEYSHRQALAQAMSVLEIHQREMLFPTTPVPIASTTVSAKERHPNHLHRPRRRYRFNRLTENIKADNSTFTQPPPTLDSEFSQLKDDYLNSLEAMEEFKSDLYLPLEGMNTPGDECTFDLFKDVQEFLKEETLQKVCLIQGAAGSGKSTFNHHLARCLWKQYEASLSSPSSPNTETTVIPLFIPLAKMYNPQQSQQDLIAAYFKDRGFSEEQIQLARNIRRFVFILDGYDEISRRDGNFYQENTLGKWEAKVIISSRPEYLFSDYQSKFCPPNELYLLREYWIAPFSTAKIKEYIQQYTLAKSADSSAILGKDFKERIFQSDVRDLISNPFILRMVIMLAPIVTTIQGRLTRVVLYEYFINHWFKKAQERLDRIQLSDSQRAIVVKMTEEDFSNHGRAYCQDLALELYRLETLTATYNPAENKDRIWERFLTDKDEKTQILRFSSPLIQDQQDYKFLHKSLRDYFVAEAISKDQSLAACSETSLINKFHLVNDSGVMDLIVEQVQSQEILQKQLLAYLEKSKSQHGASVSQAAANAITILLKSGMRFTGYDLRKVKIPHADLSFGWFDSAQFQEADLRNVRFRGAWLMRVSLDKARMDDVEFGELPSLYYKMIPRIVKFSSGGQFLAVARQNPRNPNNLNTQITTWTTSNLHTLHYLSLDDTSEAASCMDFSPKSDDLLAVGCGKATYLMSVSRMVVIHKFEGYDSNIASVNFSLNALSLATGSVDGNIIVWSIENKEPLHEFKCRTGGGSSFLNFSADNQLFVHALSKSERIELWSIPNQQVIESFQSKPDWDLCSADFSPDSRLLACGFNNGIFQLLSVPNLQEISVFHGYTNSLNSVIFSPNGQLIGCGWDNGTVGLWSVLNQRLIYRFESHTTDFKAISLDFSPKGSILACCGSKEVRLWSIPNKQLTGNNRFEEYNRFRSLAVDISPDNQVVACGSDSSTINLWDVQNEKLLARFEGHHGAVNAVKFSPDNRSIASGGLDGTVKVWSIKEKHLIHTFEGHKGKVSSVKFNHDSNMLASAGSDGVVNLWSIPNKQHINTLRPKSICPIYDVNFFPDGQSLIIAGETSIQIWSITNRQPIFEYEEGIKQATISSRADLIAFLEKNTHIIQLSSVPNFKPIGGIRVSAEVHRAFASEKLAMALSPDCKLLALGTEKTLELYSVESKKTMAIIQCDQWASCLCWEGEQLCTGGNDGIIRLWRVKNSKGTGAKLDISCVWASSQTSLCANGAVISGVSGLSMMNDELLRQRGAIGIPYSMVNAVLLLYAVFLVGVLVYLFYPLFRVLFNIIFYFLFL